MKRITWLLGLLLTTGLSRADLTFYVPADDVPGIAGPELSLVAHANLNNQLFFDVPSVYVGTGGFPVSHAYELQGSEGQVGQLQSFTLTCPDGLTSLEVPSQDSLFWGGPDPLPMPGEILTMPGVLDCGLTRLDELVLPLGQELLAAWPNPFNPTTTLSFDLVAKSTVTLNIYNMRGERVQKLVEGGLPAGRNELVFDAADLPSGLYLAQLVIGPHRISRKLLLLR